MARDWERSSTTTGLRLLLLLLLLRRHRLRRRLHLLLHLLHHLRRHGAERPCIHPRTTQPSPFRRFSHGGPFAGPATTTSSSTGAVARSSACGPTGHG